MPCVHVSKDIHSPFHIHIRQQCLVIEYFILIFFEIFHIITGREKKKGKNKSTWKDMGREMKI